MISKKRAAVLVIAIAVIVGLIASILTYSISTNNPNRDDKIYISSAEYQNYLKFFGLNAIDEIITQTYYQQIDEKDLIDGALRGMVAALDDPYSSYYTEEEFKAFNESYEGTYTGVGMLIQQTKDDEYLIIAHVFDDSPAQKANIIAGDKIIEVDGEDMAGVDMETVASLVRGPKGTKVTLTLERAKEQFSIECIRMPVEIDRVSYNMLDDKIGYISIYEFSGNSVEKLEDAIAFMKDEKAEGVIIDIRGNPGGFMNHVTKMLDMILPEGKLVYTKGRDDIQNDVRESDNNYWDMPIVVLVDGYSASASEIFAGAIQDFEAGEIVGVTTYGKGVVQSIIEIPEIGSGIKLTTATYFTPLGRNINGIGIYPDYYVELPQEVLDDPSKFNEDTDTQLKKAKEVLSEIIK